MYINLKIGWVGTSQPCPPWRGVCVEKVDCTVSVPLKSCEMQVHQVEMLEKVLLHLCSYQLLQHPHHLLLQLQRHVDPLEKKKMLQVLKTTEVHSVLLPIYKGLGKYVYLHLFKVFLIGLFLKSIYIPLPNRLQSWPIPLRH